VIDDLSLTPSPSPAGRGEEEADNTTPAFPASEETPGQAESRTAHQIFRERREECPWWAEFIALRREGWTWRVAAYIAWASSPVRDRWPASQETLAVEVLGLKSDRVIRNWKKKFEGIDERIAELQVAPLMKHRRDVIDALITVASTPEAGAHQDRKLFLQMTGDAPEPARLGVDVRGALGVDDLAELDDDELDERIARLSAAVGTPAKGGTGGGTGGEAAPAEGAD